MGIPKPWGDKPWGEMTADEKLEMLRHDMALHQRQSAVMEKTLDELMRRTREIERRFEDLMLD
jgi:hypothetical protein